MADPFQITGRPPGLTTSRAPSSPSHAFRFGERSPRAPSAHSAPLAFLARAARTRPPAEPTGLQFGLPVSPHRLSRHLRVERADPSSASRTATSGRAWGRLAPSPLRRPPAPSGCSRVARCPRLERRISAPPFFDRVIGFSDRATKRAARQGDSPRRVTASWAPSNRRVEPRA